MKGLYRSISSVFRLPGTYSVSAILAMFIGLCANAQIIANPGFETYTSLPTTYSQISRATGWQNPLGITAGTPDYFNTLGTFHVADVLPPKNGTGYAGGFSELRNANISATDYKEYITRQIPPLQAGATYILSFYVAHLYGNAPVRFNMPAGITFHDLPASERGYLGAVFSTAAPVAANTVGNTSPRWTSIRDDFGIGRALIPGTHTDVYGAASRNAWVKVRLAYTATGTEEYITLGQFRPGGTSLPADLNGVYYVFDEVTVSEVCTQPGVFNEAGEPSMTGISDLDGFAAGWPQNIPNGYIVMESRNSGFVITRVNSSGDILSPVEGMLIYDISSACVKLYNGTVWNCLEKSCNE